MQSRKWKTYAFWIVFTEAVGLLSALLTREGVAYYSAFVRQPSFAPPAVLFPIVWTVLYALMGVGAARIWMAEPGNTRSECLRLYGLQLAFNFFWSLIFFNLRHYGFALVWLVVLWLLILAMLLLFKKVDRLAGLLQIPYLLWVAFAGVLTAAVMGLNP